MTTESKQAHMYSACLEWLTDWMTYSTDGQPTLVDEYDVTDWMEGEMCEAIHEFLQIAFRKLATRTKALEILRALVWESYLFERDRAIHAMKPKPEVVERLLSMPQTAQKSAAWHAEARNLLTGHEFAHVVYGTPKAIEAKVAKKCAAEAAIDEDECMESRTVYITPEEGGLSPFQWGWRYEPVIRALFEEVVAGGRVDDSLGRIRHPTLPRLAASPDGLICEGPKAGRLVEIKAPFSRELTGVLPTDYYCQMQLQAEVTDVDAVEYIEVRFDAQAANRVKDSFVNPTKSNIPHKCGVILVVAPTDEDSENPDKWTYAYSPIWDLTSEGIQSAKAWMPKEGIVLERSIWRVQDWWTTTVPRNRRWWKEVGQPAYESFWRQVDEARSKGTYKSQLLIVDSDDEEEAEEVEPEEAEPEEPEVEETEEESEQE